MTITPSCQGWARFSNAAQADYVAERVSEEEGVLFQRVDCGDHFHVQEVANENR